MTDRNPPQSASIERSVLGSMIISPDVLDDGMEALTEEYFYAPANKKIFRAIKILVTENKPVDVVTLSTQLVKLGCFEEIGAEPYLSELMQNIATSANIQHHCKELENLMIRRQVLESGYKAIDNACRDDLEAREMLSSVQRDIFEIGAESHSSGVTHISETLSKTFEKIASFHAGQIDGISTGFHDLDTMTAGLHPTDLIIVAGRPSMGKTSFALSIVAHIGGVLKQPCLFFSLEMSKEQLVMRQLCSQAQVSMHLLRIGRLHQTDHPRLSIAAGPISTANIYLDEKPAIDPLYILTAARRLKRKQGLSLIVVDYLQLMVSNKRSENRQQEVSQISSSLKLVAKELEVPVIALAQLSRSLESREDKRPMLSDLRESGSIEQDADTVMFIYRDKVYNVETAKPHVAEIIIGKQRNGPAGTVELGIEESQMRFYNLSEREKLEAVQETTRF